METVMRIDKMIAKGNALIFSSHSLKLFFKEMPVWG